MIKHLFLLIFIPFLVTSCNDKRLDEKVIKANNTEVKWYKISLITSTHDFVEVCQNGSAIEILKTNTGEIVDISVKKDTIYIKSYRPILKYNFIEKAFNYHIKFDTTATYNDWLNVYQPEFAKKGHNDKKKI